MTESQFVILCLLGLLAIVLWIKRPRYCRVCGKRVTFDTAYITGLKPPNVEYLGDGDDLDIHRTCKIPGKN